MTFQGDILAKFVGEEEGDGHTREGGAEGGRYKMSVGGDPCGDLSRRGGEVNIIRPAAIRLLVEGTEEWMAQSMALSFSHDGDNLM